MLQCTWGIVWWSPVFATVVDLRELETQLQEAREAPTKLIVSDGVFSMDGSITPLRYDKGTWDLNDVIAFPYREICDLAERENALIFLDECHATGFLGDTGRYDYLIALLMYWLVVMLQWYQHTPVLKLSKSSDS